MKLSPLGSVALLCFTLLLPRQALALADFMDDITLGISATNLKKMGAKACSRGELCLNVAWAAQTWEALLHMQGQKLVGAELTPRNVPASEAAATAIAELDEFALTPVRLTAGSTQCNAFELTRTGLSREKALDQCAKELELRRKNPTLTVWYVDEEKAEQLLGEESLEKAGQTHGDTTAARLSINGNTVEVGYGTLGTLLQPSLRR